MSNPESTKGQTSMPSTILELGAVSVETYIATNPIEEGVTQFGTRTPGDDTDINHD